MSTEEAIDCLRETNEAMARSVESLRDEELDQEVRVMFKSDPMSLADLCFLVIHHGSLHIGQAWGILKGSGISR